MKNYAPALQAHLDGGATTLCTCWQLILNKRPLAVAEVTTGATTTVETVEAHNFATGDYVVLSDTVTAGANNLNDDPHGAWRPFAVSVVDAHRFTVPVDTSADDPYTGGIVREALGFTDNVSDLTLDGMVYAAETGYVPTASQTKGDASVDNMAVEGMLPQIGGIRRADIQAGRFDFAELRIFKVNYHAPAGGRLWIRRGWLGEVEAYDHSYYAEVSGMLDVVQQPMLEAYSPECRYRSIRDPRCGVDFASLAVHASVGGGVSGGEFTATTFFETDFSEYPTGAPPEDWSPLGAPYETGATWDITADAGAVGGQLLTALGTVSGHHALVWDTPGKHGDQVVTGLVECNGGNWQQQVLARVGRTARDYYMIVIRDSGFNVAVSNDGTHTHLASNIYGAPTVGVSYYMELSVQGSTIEARIWEQGSARPSTATWSGSDSSIAAGYCGVGFWTDTPSKVFDYFSVQLGDPIPALAVDGYFDYGYLRWLSGDNSGYSSVIKTWVQSPAAITLREPPPYGIQVGDAFEVEPGCDKGAATCKTKFGNYVNFGGFPDLPTDDFISVVTKPKQPEQL